MAQPLRRASSVQHGYLFKALLSVISMIFPDLSTMPLVVLAALVTASLQ